MAAEHFQYTKYLRTHAIHGETNIVYDGKDCTKMCNANLHDIQDTIREKKEKFVLPETPTEQCVPFHILTKVINEVSNSIHAFTHTL